MKSYIWADGSGVVELELTDDHLDSCGSGQNDDAIAVILPGMREKLEKYSTETLRDIVNGYGTELGDVSRDNVMSYLIWIAIWDVKENPDFYITE